LLTERLEDEENAALYFILADMGLFSEVDIVALQYGDANVSHRNRTKLLHVMWYHDHNAPQLVNGHVSGIVPLH